MDKKMTLERARSEISKQYKGRIQDLEKELCEYKERYADALNDLRCKETMIDNLSTENSKLRKLVNLSEEQLNSLLAATKIRSIFNAFHF